MPENTMPENAVPENTMLENAVADSIPPSQQRYIFLGPDVSKRRRVVAVSGKAMSSMAERLKFSGQTLEEMTRSELARQSAAVREQAKKLGVGVPGMLANYPLEQSMWAYLMSWSGTVLKHVFRHSELWCLLLLHVTVRICFELIDDFQTWAEEKLDMGLSGIGTLGFAVALFVNFCNQAAYSRYEKVFFSSMKQLGRLKNIQVLVFSYMTGLGHRPVALQITKYCQAAHILGYGNLKQHYRDGSMPQKFDIDYVVKLGILSDAERVQLQQSSFRTI